MGDDEDDAFQEEQLNDGPEDGYDFPHAGCNAESREEQIVFAGDFH